MRERGERVNRARASGGPRRLLVRLHGAQSWSRTPARPKLGGVLNFNQARETPSRDLVPCSARNPRRKFSRADALVHGDQSDLLSTVFAASLTIVLARFVKKESFSEFASLAYSLSSLKKSRFSV